MQNILNNSSVLSFGNRYGITRTTPGGPTPAITTAACQTPQNPTTQSRTAQGPSNEDFDAPGAIVQSNDYRTNATYHILRERGTNTKRQDMDQPWWQLPRLREFGSNSKAYKWLEHYGQFNPNNISLFYTISVNYNTT